MNLAAGEAGANGSGAYFNGLHESRALAQAYDDEARRRLKDISLDLTGPSAPAQRN